MTKDSVLSIIEDLLDSTIIPLNEYHLQVHRDNGDSTLTLYHCEKKGFVEDMYALSEIFNAYSQDWEVKVENGKIMIIIR